ncbi:MAG: hypothetical protein EHM61_04430 [Acidobacteria bacterium]|nr:MAG: hypothetical protein EHM61_04430 [Acidobacteriota bacterium]
MAKGREWVEARTNEVAGELGLGNVRGRWVEETETTYELRVGSFKQDCVFSPAWLVYCSYDISQPLRGLIMNEIRVKLMALKRGLSQDTAA